eukprot:TRINITY_DN1192_c0_g1_i1.p1 TRINITY_DN1192_c0_g1~~TRINITY_DN1192_c0_g1_i1.p1  ORF type:complete len:97 (-),score=58.46 TRINITY_DN1192_c0_g1_i1:45-335(-)
MPFVQMENISAYLNACRDLGLAVHDLFQTVDLFEAKNMNQVVINLTALKRKVGGGASVSASASSGAKAEAGFKFCASCGTKLPAAAKFCASCGASQ